MCYNIVRLLNRECVISKEKIRLALGPDSAICKQNAIKYISHDSDENEMHKIFTDILNTYKELKIKNISQIVLGAAIVSFGMYNVHDVADITEGGVLGLNLLFSHWFGINPGFTNAVLTFVCFLFGYKTMGKSFIAYTSVSVFSYYAFYMFLQYAEIPKVCPGIVGRPLIAAIVGAIFVGVGVGLTVRAGAALSGDDALAMALNSRFRVKISLVYLISDLTVLLLSLTYIPLSRILYSLLTVVLSGQIIELISFKGHYRKND